MTLKMKPQTYIAQKGQFIDENNKKFFDYLMEIFKFLREMKIRYQKLVETYDLNLTPYNKEENTHIYSDGCIRMI